MEFFYKIAFFLTFCWLSRESFACINDTSTYSAQICGGSTLMVSCCNPTSTIRVQSAMYGRRSASICASEFICDINCTSSNSQVYMESICNNMRICNVSVALDSPTGFIPVCNGTDKYLEVSLRCVATTTTTTTTQAPTTVSTTQAATTASTTQAATTASTTQAATTASTTQAATNAAGNSVSPQFSNASGGLQSTSSSTTSSNAAPVATTASSTSQAVTSVSSTAQAITSAGSTSGGTIITSSTSSGSTTADARWSIWSPWLSCKLKRQKRDASNPLQMIYQEVNVSCSLCFSPQEKVTIQVIVEKKRDAAINEIQNSTTSTVNSLIVKYQTQIAASGYVTYIAVAAIVASVLFILVPDIIQVVLSMRKSVAPKYAKSKVSPSNVANVYKDRYGSNDDAKRKRNKLRMADIDRRVLRYEINAVKNF